MHLCKLQMQMLNSNIKTINLLSICHFHNFALKSSQIEQLHHLHFFFLHQTFLSIITWMSFSFDSSIADGGPGTQQHHSEFSSQSDDISTPDLLTLYKQIIAQTPSPSLFDIPASHLKQHAITLSSQSDYPFHQHSETPSLRDCLFFITGSSHYGLEYRYDVLLGPFRLSIKILNLQRTSDDGDDEISQMQLGAGGYGNVRVVRISGEEFAVKRLPFQVRFEPLEHYDFQAQANEQGQLRRCLREFCIFKVASLLGVGPAMVQAPYDLVCFNNCLEFRMQLCQPLAQDRFWQDRTIFPQISGDLHHALYVMHFFGFVHRDIKPDNVLFSPRTQKFLFGDFGLALLLKQTIGQKSTTRFAGTMGYCGMEMRRLRGGQLGQVDLFLNDLESLKMTLAQLEREMKLEDSQISANPFSRRQSEGECEDSQPSVSISEQDSLRQGTDSSLQTPTTRSLVTFPTNLTEAPRKNASSINHHISIALHDLCRMIQQLVPITPAFIQSYIIQLLTDQRQQIVNRVYQQALVNLIPDGNILNVIKQWKIASRHYGPTSEVALTDLQAIINSVEPKQKPYLLRIKRQLQDRGKGLAVDQFQIKMLKRLRHFSNYCLALINFIRQEINHSCEKQMSALKSGIFIAQEYIICTKTDNIAESQLLKLTQLVLIYFKKEPNSPRFDISRNSIVSCINFVFQYLVSLSATRIIDLTAYLHFHISYIHQNKNILQIEDTLRLLKEIQEKTREQKSLKVKFWVASTYLRVSEFYPHVRDRTEAAFQQLIKLTEGNRFENLLVLEQYALMQVYSQKKEKALEIATKNKTIFEEIRKSQTMGKNFIDYLSARNYRFLGEIYAKMNCFKEAESNLRCALTLFLQLGVQYLGKQAINSLLDLTYVTVKGQKNFTAGSQYIKSALNLFRETKVIGTSQFLLCLQTGIHIYLQEGITQTNRNILKFYIFLLIDVMHNHLSVNLLTLYPSIINLNHSYVRQADRITVLKIILKYINHPSNRLHFHIQYQTITYELGKYYLIELKHLNEGLKYLWMHIDSRMKFNLKDDDYQVMNMFVEFLMKSQSFRRAIIFLKRYVWKIPAYFHSTRKKGFYLLYRAANELDDKMIKMYHEIAKNHCDMLTKKDYNYILAKEANIFKKKLLAKWFAKL